MISKLDYLKELGVDTVWMCPTYKSPMKDFGYDISDYKDVNPDFGTLADMTQLIEEVHKRGMRILLDLVITHTSDQHAWFLESRSSKDNPKQDWYIWKDARPGNVLPNTTDSESYEVEEPTNWKACFGGSAWEWSPERNQYFIHLFLAEEPDLNWEKPEVRKAVFDAAIGFWLDKGVDGFRIGHCQSYQQGPHISRRVNRIAWQTSARKRLLHQWSHSLTSISKRCASTWTTIQL